MANNTTETRNLSTEEESLMQFPMIFPIKIFGLNNPTFPTVMGDLASKHFDDFDRKKLNIAFSRKQKYMALTITVNAQSKKQLDDFYMAITNHPMVLKAL